MKKLYCFLAAACLACILFFVYCNKKNEISPTESSSITKTVLTDDLLFKGISEEEKGKILRLISKQFGLDVFATKPTITENNSIFSTLSTSGYSNLIQLLDKNNIRLCKDTKNDLLIAFLYFKNNVNNFLVLKTKTQPNGLLITKTLAVSCKEINGDKIFFISNGGKENIKVVLSPTKDISVSGLNEQMTSELYNIFPSVDCTGNHGGTGFCQREENESFADCYAAEKAEFVKDDIAASLVMDLQPYLVVPIIAASCICDASPCEQ